MIHFVLSMKPHVETAVERVEPHIKEKIEWQGSEMKKETLTIEWDVLMVGHLEEGNRG